MKYFSVECEAPGGGYGPDAVLLYDKQNRYIQKVEYLDLEFEVWLGGELVQHIACFCVSEALWGYLKGNGVTGVSVREMKVTPGDIFFELNPHRVIPCFKELVLPRTLIGEKSHGWKIKKDSIPDADMFTGTGLPLFVTAHMKEMLSRYGVTGLEFEEAFVTDE